MKARKPFPAGYLMILLASVLFGSYGVWSKLMGNEFGVFFQAWVHSLIIIAILIPLLIVTKSFRRVEKADRKWMLITIVLSLFAQAPLYYAFVHTSIGTATLLFYALYIVSSYTIGRLFLGEKITTVKVAAMVLAIAGLCFTFGLSLSKFSVLGLLMAMLSGIGSGAEVSTSKKSSDKYSSLQITAYVWGGIFITHLPLSLLTHEKQYVPTFDKQWLAMAAYSAASLIAFWLAIEAYKYVDASLGSLIGLSEIIWGVLFGVWFFHEHAGLTVWIGGALILTAGMLPDLVNIVSQRRKEIPEPLRGL